jgi:hypothetical protein
MPQEPQDASIIILDSIKKAKTDIVNAINAIVVSGGAGLISITYANLMLKIAGSTLSPGSFYKITDRGDVCLIFQAISTNQLAVDGIRVMLCPTTYATVLDTFGNNWLGIWQPTLTPAVDDLVIWGGIVWHNATGNVGTAVNDIALSNDWQQWSKTAWFNHEYIEMVFGCQYDWINDYVIKQWDNNDNVFVYNSDQDTYNNCDISDWNWATNGYGFYSNHCRGVYNNSNKGGITDNFNSSTIYNNANNGVISTNANNSEVANNSNNGDIYNNFNNGIIENNSNLGNIINNANNGSISNCDSGVLPCNIQYNVNNGSISGSYIADVNDPVVNK